jgi:hypothetical protein
MGGSAHVAFFGVYHRLSASIADTLLLYIVNWINGPASKSQSELLNADTAKWTFSAGRCVVYSAFQGDVKTTGVRLTL